MIGIGIGIPLTRGGVSAPTLGTTMATTHYNRVNADGGVLPAGISGLSSVLDSVIAAYGVTDSTDFNTKVPVFLDPHYTGYKLGAGSGTTLGQAARTVYSISSSADVTQTTAASQPLLLAHSGVNYWWGSGVAGNYVSTPNAAANQITGDFEAIIKVNFYLTSSDQMLLCKFNVANNFAYEILLEGSTKKIWLIYSTNGSNVFFDTSTASGIVTNTDYWIKVSRVKLTGITSFYLSTDGTNYSLISSAAAQNANVGFFAGTNILTIGERVGGIQYSNAKIYRATISNTIGGAPVVDFNPASYNAATSQTAWTSSTGEVWTINADTSQTGYKGILVDRTIAMSDGIDDQMKAIYNTINNNYTVFYGRKGLTIADVGNGLDAGREDYYNSVQQGANDLIRVFMNFSNGGYYFPATKLRLGILTLDFNSGTNKGRFNSDADTNNSYAITSTGLNAVTWYKRTGNQGSAIIINSYIESTTIATSVQKIAMYNVLKTMNNL